MITWFIGNGVMYAEMPTNTITASLKRIEMKDLYECEVSDHLEAIQTKQDASILELMNWAEETIKFHAHRQSS